MSNSDPFDPSLYMRAPILSMATGISLARALLAAVPPGMPAGVKKAAAQLGEHTDSSEGVWVQRQRADQASGEVNTRSLDTLSDRSWAALRGRLEDCSLLSLDDQPLAERAGELLTMLFGTGMGFLKATYAEQSATTAALLRRIAEDHLGKEIDAICGPEYLRAVRRIQPLYEAMLASVLRREDASIDMNPQLRALSRAIVSYAVKVAGTAEDDDPKTVERARAALRPLDNFRASYQATPRAPDPAPPGTEPPPATDPAKPDSEP